MKKKKSGSKYDLASSKKWMEKQSSGFTASFLKLPQGVSLYPLKPGKASLDVIPFVAGKNNPMADAGKLWWERTFHVHRNVGPNQSTFVCPARTLNKPCPVCEDKARIMKGDPDEEEVKLAKDLSPKEWQMVKVVDRNDTEKGVQIIATSFHRFGDEVQNAVNMGEDDESLETFWHPEGGKSLRVLWAEDSMGKTKFTRAKKVDFKDRGEEIEEELIDAICLDDLLIIPDYEKLKSLYESGEESDAPAAKKSSKKSKSKDEDEEEEEEEESEDESDEDEEEEAPKKGKASKKSKSDEDEDEDEEEESEDEDEESEDEEEEEAEAPSKKTGKKSKSKDEEEEEDEEEESEDDEEESEDEESEDDEEEEEAPKKSSKKSKSKDEDEEEEDEESEDEESEDEDDESEDEEEEEEEDEEEEAPKKSSKKSKSKKDEDEDEEEDEESEDEEEEEDEDAEVQETPKGGKFHKHKEAPKKASGKSKSKSMGDDDEPDDWNKFEDKKKKK